MKAPPPNWAAWPGNRKKLPRPTATPATAIMAPIGEFQPSLLDSFRNRRLLLSGGVKNLFGVLSVHSGSSPIFSWPESKRLGFERSLFFAIVGILVRCVLFDAAEMICFPWSGEDFVDAPSHKTGYCGDGGYHDNPACGSH